MRGGALTAILTLLTLCKADLLIGGDNVGVPQKVTHYHPFVIVISSYNNSAYIDKNLGSACSQEYPNYRIIYIDDHSGDKTRRMARKWRKKSGVKFDLYRNHRRLGSLVNMIHAVKRCRDDEIIVVLDGDDWFPHKKVLARLNQYYQNEDVWLTYGQYKEYPQNIEGMSRPFNLDVLKKGKVRKFGWHTSHLRTYYAGLFKKIDHHDLKKDGEYYTVGTDVAVMYPMMDMAREHAIYIPEIMYIYNRHNPINVRKLGGMGQFEVLRYIRHLPPYKALKSHPSGRG